MATVTPQEFAQAVLAGVGAPITSSNIAAIVGWEKAEGGAWGNDAAYNPLNTTLDAPGAQSINSAGVKAYTSWQQGVTATVATLKNGSYSGILSSLRAGNDPAAVAAAIGSSPWGTNAGTVAQTIAAAAGGSSYTPNSASTSSTGSGSSGAYGGLGGFLLKAVLTIGLVGAGLAMAAVGARGAVAPVRS